MIAGLYMATINKHRPKWLTSIMIFFVFTRENLMIAGLYMVTINMRRLKCLTSIMTFLVFTRETMLLCLYLLTMPNPLCQSVVYLSYIYLSICIFFYLNIYIHILYSVKFMSVYYYISLWLKKLPVTNCNILWITVKKSRYQQPWILMLNLNFSL